MEPRLGEFDSVSVQDNEELATALPGCLEVAFDFVLLSVRR